VVAAAASVCASPAVSIRRICSAGPMATMVPSSSTLMQIATG
jgi:hypothetical protein